MLVTDSTGQRHRFLRGMITHDLVQRGIAFEEAYEAARAIRDQIGDRSVHNQSFTTEEHALIAVTSRRELLIPASPTSILFEQRDGCLESTIDDAR